MNERFDLVIQGGGLTGLALAAAVGGVGGRVLLVEERPLAVTTAARFDGRVTAIARGSKQALDSIGAWAGMAEAAEAILEIEVGEADSLGRAATMPPRWVAAPGLDRPDQTIRQGLLAAIGAAAGSAVTIAAPASIAALERSAGGVVARLADGRQVRGALLAVCEGRFSGTRELLGIGARRWDYGQTGLVCTFAHELPHGGRAVERFFPDGPFAMLPLPGNRSSIVWALENGLAKSVAALDDAAFTAEVQERFGDSLGRLVLEGHRWTYPLILVWSHAYVAERAVLVGDAARGIHPIAGQGWNLALRDVTAIAEIVVDRLRLGLDPGSADALERYAAWRSFDSLALVAVTDGINRLFANDVLPLKLARGAGLALVERLPVAKRFFMRHAMGLVGDLPRLMRGEAL
ncbi:MAG: FAD-dependent monooxygenase [Geminicoccaceae bacterium]